jgi:LPXTG-motif cell wall-anchored protein
MKRFVLAAVVATLFVPATAAAKEPIGASISGPGFSKTLKAPVSSDWGQTALGRLTDSSGFFPAAVGQQPDPMLPGRPVSKLGPKYTVVWTVPGPPGNNTHTIEQELYPYARGGALAYMGAGQPIFDMKTRGGWYRAYGLKQVLMHLGLPARAPQSSSGSSSASLALIGIPSLLALAGIAFALRRRRAS